MTSGQDGIYPSGFVIGVVEKVEQSGQGDSAIRTITVRPAVDFTHLEVVLVILRPAKPVVKPGSKKS